MDQRPPGTPLNPNNSWLMESANLKLSPRGELERLHLGLNFTLLGEMGKLTCFSLSFSPSIVEHSRLRSVTEGPTTCPCFWQHPYGGRHVKVQYSTVVKVSSPFLTRICPSHMQNWVMLSCMKANSSGGKNITQVLISWKFLGYEVLQKPCTHQYDTAKVIPMCQQRYLQ